MASSEPQAVAPPAAAPPVEIRKTPTKGRSLVSTRTVNPGDTILVTTAPFLLPSLSHMGSVCTYCLRPDRPNPTSSGGSTLRACTRCQSARYCNADCQRTHWRAAHAKECKPLAEVHSAGRGGLPTPVRLLVQMLLGVGGAKVRGEVGQLESHVEAWRGGKQWADVEMMATAGCAYAGLETDEENIRMACEMMCRVGRPSV